MTMRLIWFVLAGFLLGFTASTLWEWLYYRRRRMVLDARRYDELREQLSQEKAVNTQLRMMLSGTDRALEPEASSLPQEPEPTQIPQPQPVAYSSPGVFLDSETEEAELQQSDATLADAAEDKTSTDDLLVAASAATVAAAKGSDSPKVVFGRLAAELEREPVPGSARNADGPDVPYVPRSDDFPDDLSRIQGIGNVYRFRLYDAGIFTWRQIAEQDANALQQMTDAYAGAAVASWPKRAQELAGESGREDAEYSGPTPQDLTRVDGLTPAMEGVLYHAGICTYGQLACLSLSELDDLFPNAGEERVDLQRVLESAVEMVTAVKQSRNE